MAANREVAIENLPPPIRVLFSQDPGAQDMQGNTPLHRYTFYSQYYHLALQLLIKNSKEFLEVRNLDGRTPFLLAAMHGHKFVIEVFIEAGANVHTKDRYNQNAAHYMALLEINHVTGRVDMRGAMRKMYSFPLLKVLLEKGIDVNLKNYRKETPLMWAARGNSLKMVKMLLKYGANVQPKSSCSKTCLHFASTPTRLNVPLWNRQGSGIISELIRNGATVNSFDCEGRTPLGHILLSGHPNRNYFAKEFLKVASLAHWNRQIDFYLLRNQILRDHPDGAAFMEHVATCYNEINRMKDIQLTEAFDLCQFALRGIFGVEQSIANEVSEIALDILMRQSFPIYNDFILFNFQIKFLRLKFKEMKFSTGREDAKVTLKADENYLIASFLGFHDLFQTIKAFWSRIRM